MPRSHPARLALLAACSCAAPAGGIASLDRRAPYRFVHSLGAAGDVAPAYLAPVQAAPPASFGLNLPDAVPAHVRSPHG